MKIKLIVLIVLSAALMLIALSTGAQIYYAMAIVLSAGILLSVLGAAVTLMTLRVSVKGLTRQAVRGDNMRVAVSVTHFGVLPVSEIRIRIAAPSSGKQPQDVSAATMPFVRKEYEQVIRCPHRGDFEAGVVRVFVTDMLGLITLSRGERDKLVRVKVLPRVYNGEPMLLTPVESGPESIQRAADDTASPVDTRKWQDGDELRRVHWKLTARKREVMVKVFEASGRPDMLIVPDLSPINALNDQALTYEDAIVEASIAMAKAQLEYGYAVRMPLVNAGPSEVSLALPQEIEHLADQLAHVCFDSPYSYEQVLMTMNSRFGRTGGIALVTSRLMIRVADMAIRMHSVGLNVRVIWVTDDCSPEQVQLIARMEMMGVSVEQKDPYLIP